MGKREPTMWSWTFGLGREHSILVGVTWVTVCKTEPDISSWGASVFKWGKALCNKHLTRKALGSVTQPSSVLLDIGSHYVAQLGLNLPSAGTTGLYHATLLMVLSHHLIGPHTPRRSIQTLLLS